jgi:hypothetical protein
MNAAAAALAVVLASLAGPAGLRADEDVPPVTLRVSEGRLSLDARDAPLQTILDEIGDRTGLRVRFDDPAQAQIGDELVTVSFERVPVEEALRRLLRGRDFVLVYSPGRLAEARVYGRSAEAPSGEPPPAASVSSAPAGEPVDRSGVAALRRDALENPDPAARARALEGLAASGDQGAAHDAVLAVLERETVPGLLRRALDIAGVQDPRARQLLESRAANDPAPEVREAARALLGAPQAN